MQFPWFVELRKHLFYLYLYVSGVFWFLFCLNILVKHLTRGMLSACSLFWWPSNVTTLWSFFYVTHYCAKIICGFLFVMQFQLCRFCF